jgi:uncharacterized membrane protein
MSSSRPPEIVVRLQLLVPAIAILLILLGWPMAARRVRPNRWYGVRLPATLTDARVWYEVNAVAGRDLIILGAALLVFALSVSAIAALPDELYAAACAVLLVVGSLLMTVRAWRLANRLRR